MQILSRESCAKSKKKIILGIQNIKGDNEKNIKTFSDIKIIFLDRLRNRSKLCAPLCEQFESNKFCTFAQLNIIIYYRYNYFAVSLMRCDIMIAVY